MQYLIFTSRYTETWLYCSQTHYWLCMDQSWGTVQDTTLTRAIPIHAAWFVSIVMTPISINAVKTSLRSVKQKQK